MTDKEIKIEKLIDYDRQRNKNREGIRALKNNKKLEKRAYINISGALLQLPSDKALDVLSSNQKIIESSINDTRNRVKESAARLAFLEGDEKMAKAMVDFQLNQISADDLYNLTLKK
ncbi:hypothetical protein BB561_001196 [Smittium simulii]|uniref:Uncharacterized protein n=1 Tax=Smittium simulii TaxID=133385 RepID=A0A2T9YVP9_9FUNG|nr:hypothetical protein BB561_001196 [Smittium simulii]